MKKNFLKTLIISSAFAVILSVSAFATSNGGVSVNASALNLRSSPNTNSQVCSIAPRGAVAVVGDKINDQWYKVVYKGNVGYMSSEFLSYGQTVDGNFGYGFINGNTVRLRSTPNLNSPVITTYNKGIYMPVIGVSGEWYKVKYNNNIGYVHSDYFALRGNFASCAASSDAVEIVDTAMKYIGTPYVWGGTSPCGFDCSGLVYYVYKENGYYINRTAATIYTNGVEVDKGNLQVGDAICFSSESEEIGHVGLYIGNQQFIHASSGSGSVTISDLSNPYYVNHYVCARRIV